MSKDTFDALLARAQLPMTDDEYQALLAMYSVIEEQVAELRLAEARYEEPAVIYPAL
jgi:hypothetical protein